MPRYTPHTQKTKDKIGKANSIAMKKLWQDPIYREMISEKRKGIKQSKETIEKRRKKMLGRKRPTFTEEWKKNMSQAQKGKKLSVEQKKKVSEKLKGRVKLEQERKNISEARKGKKLSEAHRKALSEAQKRIGTIPPSRKGAIPWNYVGATKLAKRIRKNWKYKEWRSQIFERDLYTCVNCSDKGVYIEADHYPVGFAEILKTFNITTLKQALECEILWNIDNGRTLCLPCHKLTPNYGGKKRNKEVKILNELFFENK